MKKKLLKQRINELEQNKDKLVMHIKDVENANDILKDRVFNLHLKLKQAQEENNG